MAPMTGKTSLVLRSIIPAILREPGERAYLEEDLTRIGCIGLLNKPWTVKDEKMVRELIVGAPNQYEGTIRARPEMWDAGRWREAYGFGAGGEGFASRMDKFIGGKFRNAANLKDGFAIADCEDSRAKRVLKFLIPILYPEKPTQVTVTVGNTIFGALLGERKVDWGILLQAVVTKLVDGVRKFKAMPIGPYLFHLYKGHELLNGEEMVAYEIGLDLLKYNCTPDPDPDQGQDSPTRSDPIPSPSAKQYKWKKEDRPGSSQDRGNRKKPKDLTQQELTNMAHSFEHAIQWMELAQAQYNQLGDVVVDVCKALGNVAIQDIDTALSQIVRKEEVAEQDSRINELIREKEELKERLRKTERELRLEQSKMQGAHRLIGLLEEHVRNPGDLVIKARLYDEAVAKTWGVTALKLIHICVDYSARMETILAEMRVRFDNQNRFFLGSPIPVEKLPNLTDFPDLPPADLLQNLQTPTMLRTTRDSVESGGRPTPGSDARTSEAERPQKEVPTPTQQPESAPVSKPMSTSEAQDSVPMDTTKTPPFLTNPASAIPTPPTNPRAASDPRSKAPPPVPMPPLAEEALKYMEAVRRQAAFTHTPGFQELLSQGLRQASPQRSLFRHPASAFGTLPPPQGPPPFPALPASRKAPLASRLPRSVTAGPSAKRKEKSTTVLIELEDLEDDSAHTTPPGSEERDGSGNQSDSDPPPIPPRPELVTTRSSRKAPATSRPKQKSSKRLVPDKEKPSKRSKK